MNERTRKVLLAALLVAVLTVLTAGMAFAGGWKRHGGNGGRMWNQRMGGGMGGTCCLMGNYGPHGGRGLGFRGNIDRRNADRTNVNRANAPEITQEIREKLAEVQKTAIDLRTELGKNPIDRDKALELHAKRCALMQEVSDWHFKQRLDALTAR